RDYEFIVTDENGCGFPVTFTINEGEDIQADYIIETICVNNLPQANVTILFNDEIDISELTFDLDNGAETLPPGDNVFQNVTSGPHVVTVTHTNTCQQQVNFIVTLPSTPVLTLTESGLNQFTMSTVGGEPPYEYTILNSNGTVLYVGSNTIYFINQTDTYTV